MNLPNQDEESLGDEDEKNIERLLSSVSNSDESGIDVQKHGV